MVKCGNESIEDMARAYKEKWERIPGRRKIGVLGVEVGDGEKMGKLDDLADCLLQGMAWVKWEENKRLLLKNGVEALLEP
jgi:cruciform cutting endonuclease 1